MLLPITMFGILGGVALHRLFDKNRKKLGLRDPIQERQELLTQLHELRDKLHSGEQSMTFLSVDIVGSTRMKQHADPLAVEFTFNEYHQFVERIARKYGGQVHSTAGDGVTCAFDHPQQAYGAARNLQSGLIELNMLRNKLGTPLTLRCGIHTGTVVTPDASDVTSLNFAQVIDIAAHLQKITPPGGIAVSEASASGLIGGMDAVGPERGEIEGVHAAIWVPKSLAPKPTATEPPPLPHGA
jgi:class 3 adenylate cyclase